MATEGSDSLNQNFSHGVKILILLSRDLVHYFNTVQIRFKGIEHEYTIRKNRRTTNY